MFEGKQNFENAITEKTHTEVLQIFDGLLRGEQGRPNLDDIIPRVLNQFPDLTIMQRNTLRSELLRRAEENIDQAA